MKRIHLISNPRNLSTALMYSFAQRSDTQVVDEPFYGHYLTIRPGVDHPAKRETLASMRTDAEEVVEKVIMADYTRAVVFFKDMAHHLIELDYDFMLPLTNLFLIRNPHQLIASIGQVMRQPSMEDIGSQQQYRLFQWLKEHGQQPLVLDSGELLKDPPGVIEKLCHALDIPYEAEMLHWEAGARPEDGVWARYWYANVHRSTGFRKQETSNRPLPEHLLPLYEEAKPYYEALYEYAFRA